MRRKLDTRFPASRIKRIMQTDEDVGKIALAVPLLVSKALELFLQDLCDRTYNVTLKRGAKTMCSSHLKQCVYNFSVFDFLKETVSRVPDVGCSVVVGEDRSSKRRKAVDDEGNVIDEESKRSKRETVHDSRGRGRGRARGRRRGSQETEWDFSHYNKYGGDPETFPQHHDQLEQGEKDFSRTELKEIGLTGTRVPVRDFDLNIDLDENGLATTNPVSPLPSASTITIHEMKQEEDYGAWPPPFTYIDNVTFDPLRLALVDKRMDEEEDYDNED